MSGSIVKKTEAEAFMKVVKKQAIERYANDVVKMIDDQKKLQKAYEKVTHALEEVEKGNYEVIESYRKFRNKLETEDGFEI